MSKIENLQNLVYNVNNNFSVNDFKTAFDNVNSEKLSLDETKKLSDIVLFFIDAIGTKEKDFVSEILDYCISTNLDKSCYIEYFNIRNLIPDIENYEQYLNNIVSKKIVFLNYYLRDSFVNILLKMESIVNKAEITDKVNNYIKSIKSIDNVVLTDLNILKKNKIIEMRAACESNIISGFKSSCLGSEKHFDCDRDSQLCMQSLLSKAILLSMGVPLADNILEWKASGEAICYPFTLHQIKTLAGDLNTHLIKNKKQFENLRIYINASDRTLEELKSVRWDSNINK